jgi:hypothetical protein
MGDRRYGLTSKDRLYTIDDVPIESVVSNTLIPMINRYNSFDGLDWRGLLCENGDTDIIRFDLPDTDRLDQLGPHEIPFMKGSAQGTWQRWVKRYGNAFGFDTNFLMEKKADDYVKQMAKSIEWDKNRIRHNILRSVFAPIAYGDGFWNQTFGTNEGITTPPAFGLNTFTASHTHYLCTGTAAITTTNIFETAKQHIREHGKTNGQYLCIMNSNDLQTTARLSTWVATGGTNLRTPLSDLFATNGVESEMTLQGINFISDEYVPSGYFVMFGGIGMQKPLKFIEHKNSQFRGLMWIPGKNDAALGGYPITDSYCARIFDVDVFSRYQGVVYQVTTNYTYTAPTDYNKE